MENSKTIKAPETFSSGNIMSHILVPGFTFVATNFQLTWRTSGAMQYKEAITCAALEARQTARVRYKFRKGRSYTPLHHYLNITPQMTSHFPSNVHLKKAAVNPHRLHGQGRARPTIYYDSLSAQVRIPVGLQLRFAPQICPPQSYK
jgi:hypothetical protein